MRIAFPAILESMVLVIIATIDTRMISGLGKAAISAVSFTVQPKLIFLGIFFALGTTVSMLVAQANGKKDEKEGNYCFHTILKITILLSVILGTALWFLAGPIMMICNRQADTRQMSVSFFRIIMGGMIFQTVSIVLNAALRGVGKTKVTLLSNIAMGLTDILFNYLLIEGHWGFPRLEIAGDAIATVIGTAVACAISIIAIITSSGFLHFKGMLRERIFAEKEKLRIIAGKAGNIIFENLFMRLGFLMSSIIVSLLSSDETAVYSVAMILLNYSFAFGDGIQSATVALTGRSYGAKDVKSVKQYARIGLLFGTGCAVVLGTIYLTTYRPYYGSFFNDEAALADGLKSSVFVAGITFLQIIRIVETGVLRGMGEVRDPRRVATVCVTVVNPLCSYLFAFPCNFGVWGVWMASVVSQGLWMILSSVFCLIHVKKLKGEQPC